MNPQTLKEYVVVMRHDAVPSIWTRSQWRDYLKNCEEIDHPNTKETGYYIAATFSASDELKDSPYQGSAEAVKILKQLCELKRYKDTLGKDSFYEKRQPELWKLANDFLNGIADSAASPAGDGLPPHLEEMIKREPVTFFLVNILKYLDMVQRVSLRDALIQRTPNDSACITTPPNKSI